MSCFEGICGGATDERTRAAEAELKKQLAQLQQDVKESNAKVAAAKKEREQSEQDASAKEQKAIEVKAKVAAKQALAPQVAATKEATNGGCFACFEGASDREKAMKRQVEKLQNELVASQEQVSQLRVVADSAQKDVVSAQQEVQKARSRSLSESRSSSELVATRTNSFNSMFAKDVSAFRTATPANQRVMKGAIVALLNKLDNAEADLQEEEELKKQSQAEAAEHEKIVKQLQGRANENLFSFMHSGSSNAWFREQTPAKQREMKDELLQLLQDLEGLQAEKSEHEVVRDLSERKLSNLRKRTGSDVDVHKTASTNSGFAFQQQAEPSKGRNV